MLAERVDHVIGVDTHRDAHTAAVVEAATGAVVAATDTAANPGRVQAAAALRPASRRITTRLGDRVQR